MVIFQGNFYLFHHFSFLTILPNIESKTIKIIWALQLTGVSKFSLLLNLSKGEFPFLAINCTYLTSGFLALFTLFIRHFKMEINTFCRFLRLIILIFILNFGMYLFSLYMFLEIKPYLFDQSNGDIIFSFLSSLFITINNTLLGLLIYEYNQISEIERFDNNSLIYFVKYIYTVSYGLRMATIGNMRTLSTSFWISILFLIINIVNLHLEIKIVSKIKNLINRFIFNEKSKIPTTTTSELQFSFTVSKLLSYQRVEVHLASFTQILHLYWRRKIFSIPFISKDTSNILDCKMNLISSPNFFNMLKFCLLDFFTTFALIYNI